MPTPSSASLCVPCAVIHAGPDTMLAIPVRDGRFPIKVQDTSEPMLQWICADGALEHIALEGSEAKSDHATLLRDFARDGILVAEVRDPQDPMAPDATYHLVERAPRETQRERTQ